MSDILSKKKDLESGGNELQSITINFARWIFFIPVINKPAVKVNV